MESTKPVQFSTDSLILHVKFTASTTQQTSFAALGACFHLTSAGVMISIQLDFKQCLQEIKIVLASTFTITTRDICL